MFDMVRVISAKMQHLGMIHGLKVIRGSQRVEREPGNEASTVKMHSISAKNSFRSPKMPCIRHALRLSSAVGTSQRCAPSR